ncbi:MAG: hypothetical protein KDK99_13060, partial [Verrucomicrobiales bacterium]|nr:hypothetical protein [Verrucomicrobiales bacterium]
MSLRLPSLFVVAILTGAAFGAESKPAAPAPKATTAPALRADSSRKLEDAAGNFRLKIAAADWKNALVPDSVPFARYAWTHARMPGLTAWFGVEELPPEAPWGLGEQVRYAETRLLMDPAELQVWGQQRAAGQMWARIGHLGKMDGLVSSFGVFQDQYMLWNNGFLYQLHLFGRAEDQDQITAAARQILGTFSIIEPERIAKPRAELAQAPAWESRGLGLRVPGMVGWLPLSNAASNAPHLHHCRIRTASSAGIGFAAARIDGADLSERQMIDAALATLMIGYDERQVSVSAYEPSPAPPGLKRAFQLKTERPVDGTPTSYRFLVLLTDRAFYALSAWADRGDRAGLEAAEHALSFAQFTPLEGSTPPPLLDADETRIRSSLFNQFGLGAAAEGRFEDALPWFEKGLLIDAKNWDILANFSYTLSRLGRSSEAADRISTA